MIAIIAAIKMEKEEEKKRNHMKVSKTIEPSYFHTHRTVGRRYNYYACLFYVDVVSVVIDVDNEASARAAYFCACAYKCFRQCTHARLFVRIHV